ncbi:MAG: phage tail protein [Oscillospiraceae bacterium]
MGKGNKIAHLFLNRNPEPLPGYKFKVYITMACFGFTKITNLEEEVGITPLQEGGVNDYVHCLESPVTAEHTLIMERGVVLSTLAGTFKNRLLDIGQHIPGDVTITLHNRDGFIGRCFMVSGARVKKITYDGLDSMNGNTVIQRFELSYEKMETVGLPGIPDMFV